LSVEHDVGIYTTSAATAGFYDRDRGRAGGAERQMTLLARVLAERGHRVAHIVYPARDPVELPYPVDLVYRGRYAGDRAIVGRLLELGQILRALHAADARVTIVRTASPVVGVAALYCRLRRRRLVFSSANVSDFTLERMAGRLDRSLYGLGVKLADAVVVQSDEQVALVRRAFPGLRRVVRIRSFAERAPAGAGEGRPEPPAFLWYGRFVSYKQPLEYLTLARSVPEARFVMIPVPDEASSEELSELRSAASEVPNLELREPLPHGELLRLLRSAVAIVNTSALEGMPNAFLEAWAQGVPVLTLQFDPDGVVERQGLGVSAHGSRDRFVEGAHELWRDRDDREELSQRVRAYVDKAHSLDAVGAEWSRVIAEVSGSGRPSSAQPSAVDDAARPL
jgi:glycosyltransferase involved in cell wall biosynthesis